MDAPQARRELLRAYFISLAAEGHFVGLSPAGVLVKMVELLSRDVPAVGREVIDSMAQQGAAKVGAIVIGKLSEIADKLRSSNLREVLGEVQAAYRRGLDNTARRKK